MTTRPAIGPPRLTDVLVPACSGTDAGQAISTAVGIGRRLDLPVRSFEVAPDGSAIATKELRCGSSTAPRQAGGRGSDAAPLRWSSSLLVQLMGTPRRRGRLARHGLPSEVDPYADMMIGPACADSSHETWRQLVVPIDGSAEADAVAPIAASWATAYGLELSLVGVVVPEPPPLREGRDAGRHRFLVDPIGHLHDLVDMHQINHTQPLLRIIVDRLSASAAIADHLRKERSTVLVVPASERSSRSQ